MPQRNKDDLARALEAMTGGFVPEPPPSTDAPASSSPPRRAAAPIARPIIPAGDPNLESSILGDPTAMLSRVSDDDDDRVVAPPPDISVLASHPAPHAKATAMSLHLKRTMIPILLTCGVLLPCVASLKWLAGPSSIFAAWDTWLVVVMFLTGAALLGLAAMNVLQVRDALAKRR